MKSSRFNLEGANWAGMILDHMTDAVFILDARGSILFCNPAGRHLHGYSDQELESLSYYNMVHPDYQQVFSLYLHQVMEHGSFLGETVELHKDGTLFYVEARGSRFLYQGSEYILSVVRDMSEHRQMEKDIRNSEEVLSDLYENAPDIYLSVDAHTTEILHCNRTFLEVMGYADKKQILGRSVFDFYQTDSHEVLRDMFSLFLKKGEVRDQELQVVTSGGKVLDMSLNATAVRDPQGRILRSRSVWRDISRRKKAENDLIEEKDRLQKALQEISTLKGLLPICSSCKKIRDDKGYWKEIEEYIAAHSDAQFSHGICPDCARRLYPGMGLEKDGH